MRSIGKYEILAELGRGGMGVVYRARDPFINRLVALKTITNDMSGNKALLERFYVEARSAGNLQHSSIVTIYELGEHEGAPFIAMEYIEGETLERMIARKPDLPLAVKLGYVVRIGEGIRFAHEHGVIHRDVKPANIMVTAEGVVKVVDFGIARLKDTSMTQANLVIGSRAYMAPQLYEGQRADARSDIWALGVTLYELVAYEKPFVAESEAALMFKVLREDPPPLRELSPNCPEALEKVVRRMLEKSVTARYQSMDDLLVDLRNLWEKAQEETVPPLLAESRRLMEASEYRAAQDLLRQVLQIDNASLAAKSLFEQVSREVKRQELLPLVQEHVDRGRMQLQRGDFSAARAEANSALGLDTRCEPAQQLRREVDEAAQRAEQLEQRLKFVKQRLLDGALTEATQALAQATDLSATDARVLELKKQIAEEKARREKRDKLARANRLARDLWMEQKYAECLAVLEEALKEFPSDRELLKLQETARQDWAEEEKQRRLGQARRHLGQQQFAEARGILEELAKRHPQDNAIGKLMALVNQGEEETKKRERLETELVKIRKLVREEKYEAALAQGEPLVREFPDEFELKELVGYARAEWTQQRLRRNAQDQETHIRELLQTRRYVEAAAAAQRATQEFSGHPGFRQLWDEADRKRKEEDAKQESQRRIQEIQRMISRQDLTDAIDLAQQTLATMGYDQNVSQLLRAATAEQEEKNRRRELEKLHDVKTLVDAGKSEEATRMLHDAFATQILQSSHPQAQELLTLIQRLPLPSQTGTTQALPVSLPANMPSVSPPSMVAPVGPSQFSATSVLSQTPPPVAPVSGSPANYSTPTGESDAAAAARGASIREAPSKPSRVPPAAVQAQVPVSRPEPIRGPESVRTETKTEHRAKAASISNQLAAATQTIRLRSAVAVAVLKRGLFPADPLLRRRTFAILIICAAVIGVLVVGATLWNISRKSRQLDAENGLRAEAQQLWDEHEPDQSEKKWKQIAALHGPLATQATQQIALIEQKRVEEQQRFEAAQSLFQRNSKDPQALQGLQEVAEMHLWHASDAQNLLGNIAPTSAPPDLSKQEQALFAEGERLFASGNFDAARLRFRDLVGLNVPNSTLLPKAQEYLKKIRSSNDDKKNYDAAMEDFQNENWNAAADGFRAIVDRKGPQKDDAQKQLGKIASAQGAIGAVEDLIHSHSYRAAKAKIDAMQQWPKSSDRLRQENATAEEQEFNGLKSRAQSLFQKQDISGLEHLQDDLQIFSSREQDPATQRAAADLDRNLNAQLTQLKKDLSGDNAAFAKAEKDFQEARGAGDVNRLNTDVLREFEQIAQGNGYNRVAAQSYVNSVIPSAIKDLTQNLASKGKAVVPAISCATVQFVGPAPEANGQTFSCAQLGLHWIGNPTVDLPGAKEAGKLPYTLKLIIAVDGNGKIFRVEKDGAAEEPFLKKAKEAAKEWKSTPPMLNGKPVKASFPIEITFQVMGSDNAGERPSLRH